MSSVFTHAKRIVLILLLGLLVPGSFEQAHSFMLHRDGNQYTRWFQADMPVHYSINPSGFPSGSIAAIQNGFQAWQDVTTATITFTYDGTTTVNTTGDDGTNVVMMVTNSSDWTHDGDVAAWTTAWVNASTGRIWAADTEFNGTPEFTQTYYSW